MRTFGMDDLVSVDSSGALVLPRSIREALHITKPASFLARVNGDKLELTLVSAVNAVIEEENGVLVVSTGGKNFNAAEAVAVARDSRG